MAKSRHKYRLTGILLQAMAVVTTAAALIWSNLVIYGIQQGIGQAGIILGAKPIATILDEPPEDGEIINKLKLTLLIRRFAFDSLGLDENGSYTRYFDQKGKPLLWVVTASEPYELKAHEWDYALLGKMPYKGFFKKYRAQAEYYRLKDEGLDTDMGRVSGWSTLGFLDDPLLSQMLNNREGELAELLIHELTHGTLYVRNNADFNENLASFTGRKGALMFLKIFYGPNSKQMTEYLNGKEDEETFHRFILHQTSRLDSLYKSPGFRNSEKKDSLKTAMIREIYQSSFRLKLHHTEGYQRYMLKSFRSGNAFFMQYVRYEAQQDTLEDLFTKQAGGSVKNFIALMRLRYGKQGL